MCQGPAASQWPLHILAHQQHIAAMAVPFSNQLLDKESFGSGISHPTVEEWCGKKTNELANLPAPSSRQHFDVWSFQKAPQVYAAAHLRLRGTVFKWQMSS
jgi:hypothetical protein